MGKRKQKPPVTPPHEGIDTTKPVEIHFPIRPGVPLPKEIIPVPVHIDPAKICHLPIPLDLTHCEVTLVDPYFGEAYLWLKVPEGFKMPDELLKPGQTVKADVSFAPPAEENAAYGSVD
jgi:hypothetical protein